MRKFIAYSSVIAFILLKCSLISAQMDYPPVLDETLKITDSRAVKCLVCKATLDEMLSTVNKVDPKKTVEIGGYRLDSKGNALKKVVKLSKSETYLTELMENICDKMDDYAKARFKTNGTLTLIKMTTPDGGMNPNMSLVDFIQDGDLNKSLKHFCLEVLEDNEDDVLKSLMQEKISDDIDIEVCTVAAKYCDDVLPENDYVLEEHEEL
ncbi:protein seele [Contarinia nasturtii]|uniref:protein seele n=1 Tax=Contarinia nasturtii TaxID=265458 RepID=UPI0012D38A8B|nr:protein seele [Contarinia nasturtii]